MFANLRQDSEKEYVERLNILRVATAPAIPITVCTIPLSCLDRPLDRDSASRSHRELGRRRRRRRPLHAVAAALRLRALRVAPVHGAVVVAVRAVAAVLGPGALARVLLARAGAGVRVGEVVPAEPGHVVRRSRVLSRLALRPSRTRRSGRGLLKVSPRVSSGIVGVTNPACC